jgi:hypothetical protein
MELNKDQTALVAVILQTKMGEQQNRGVQPLAFIAQLLLTKDAERFPILEGWLREMKLTVVATIGALDLNRIQAEQKLRAKDAVLDFLIQTAQASAVAPTDSTPKTDPAPAPSPAVAVEPAAADAAPDAGLTPAKS